MYIKQVFSITTTLLQNLRRSRITGHSRSLTGQSRAQTLKIGRRSLSDQAERHTAPGRSLRSSPHLASNSPVRPKSLPRLPRDTRGLVRDPRTVHLISPVRPIKPTTIKTRRVNPPRLPRHRRNVDAKKRNISVRIAKSYSIGRSASAFTLTRTRVINVRRDESFFLFFLGIKMLTFPALIQPIHVHSPTVRVNST